MAVGALNLVIYVAGPYRAPTPWEVEQNVRRAEELALGVWRLGMAALCPHTLARFYNGSFPDEAALRLDLAMVARCDAVLLVPGWERSVGARGEKDYASRAGIPVFESLFGVDEWRESGAPGRAVDRLVATCDARVPYNEEKWLREAIEDALGSAS
jgi:hypothetical protein